MEEEVTSLSPSSRRENYSSLLNTMNHIKFNDCKASLLEEGLREMNYKKQKMAANFATILSFISINLNSSPIQSSRLLLRLNPRLTLHHQRNQKKFQLLIPRCKHTLHSALWQLEFHSHILRSI